MSRPESEWWWLAQNDRSCCPNCGEPDSPPLYSAIGVTHCGCFWDKEPNEVLYHFSEVDPPAQDCL